MISNFKKLLGVAAPLLLAASAMAQRGVGPGWTGCIDPGNTAPFSADFGVNLVTDSLMTCTVGGSGTVTYGDVDNKAPVPCFPSTQNVTANVRGRVGFMTGASGSIQTPLDDAMPLTFGMPIPGDAWSYACLSEDGKRTLFGANALVTTFTGASDRYVYAESINNKIDIALRADVIADATRLTWTITNQDTATHALGLWYGAWTAMIDANGDTSGWGWLPPTNGTGTDKSQYIVVPGAKPLTTEHRYRRDTDASSFPSYVDFSFGQTLANGLRVLLGPTPDTEDAQGLNSDATLADEIAIGQDFFLLGGHKGGDNTFPDVMFGPLNSFGERSGGDIIMNDQPGFIEKYFEQQVPPSSSRTIISYYRLSTGTANYSAPYSVLVDGPQLIASNTADPSGLSQPAGGYTIRVWIDNTRGFSAVDKSIELDDVRVTLNLPAGLNLVAGDSSSKLIPKILPGQTTNSFVDFHVAPDGVTTGTLTYSVTVNPTPGPIKTISSTVNVADTPKLQLAAGANLISTPWDFADTSWETILGLTIPTDFQAFTYDPAQNGYVPTTSAARGKATWLVTNSNLGVLPLKGNPTEPTDLVNGTRNIQLLPGWNLIGNPFDYGIQLGQLVGVSAANPSQSYSWADLVSQGYVNGAVAYFNSTTGGYSYVQANTDVLQPNVGYWIFNATQSDVTLNYPPVFAQYLPNSTRSATTQWAQTDSNWRLQLVARSGSLVDNSNYIGRVASSAQVTSLQVAKPPMTPAKAGIQLAVEGAVNGKQTRLAQALTSTATNQSWTVDVNAKQDGPITLTWPNLPTVPKSIQFRLVDKATGQTRLLSQASGYTFTAKAGTTRQFQIQTQTGTAAIMMIANASVSRSSRSPNSPFTISYTLNGAATTSIRILGASGSEVYTVTSGRADQAGQNSAIWSLRDNANRSVAPGIYQVEIVAEDTNGNRVRKIVPINVVR